MKKIIIIIVLLIAIVVGIATGIYFAYYHEDITQIKKEVTISYTGKAENSSAFYFEGQRSEVTFDKSLFTFDEIKDYEVTLPFREKEYSVIFHVIDDVKPEISFLSSDIDLMNGFDLKKMYTVHDKGEVTITQNLQQEDIVVGNQEFCVIAKDASNNESEKCQKLNVVDSTPKLNVSAKVSFDYDYKNMSLEAILKDYKEKKGLTNQIAISYHNFVSNETYFDNPDQYMVAGSTYKLPLNMYYYEQRNSGAIRSDQRLKYMEHNYEEGGPVGEKFKPGDELSIADLQFYSIVWSDNTASKILVDGIGGWGAYREYIKKYSSITSYPDAFNGNNFSVRYMNDVLTYLYNNAQAFPELIDRLFGVGPGDSLKKYVYVPILQKDGIYDTARNAAGIVYGDKPYAAAIYVAVGDYGTTIIGEVNLILYNYSLYH